MKINIQFSESGSSLEGSCGAKYKTLLTAQDLDKFRPKIRSVLLAHVTAVFCITLQSLWLLSRKTDGKYDIRANICVCWVLGCSLHGHACGGYYKDAGAQQRRETRAFLHAGHSDLKKGKK